MFYEEENAFNTLVRPQGYIKYALLRDNQSNTNQFCSKYVTSQNFIIPIVSELNEKYLAFNERQTLALHIINPTHNIVLIQIEIWQTRGRVL